MSITYLDVQPRVLKALVYKYNSGGSKGGHEGRPRSKFFHFYLVFGDTFEKE